MRFALSLGLVLLAAGCASAPEGASSSESEVVANSATNVAGLPATSEDGKSVYWVDARSIGARLMRIDMAEPLRSQPEAQLGAVRTTVDRFEARGAWLFYSGTVLGGASVVGQIPIGQTPWRFELPEAAHVAPGDIAATKNGLVAFIARGSTTSQLYVFDGSTKRMASDLVWPSSPDASQQLVESNDGKSLLFYDRAEGKARTITSDLDGPVVSAAIDAPSFGEIVSYDGRYLLWNKEGDLSNIDLTNGRQTFYVERTNGVWVHGPRILYLTAADNGETILNTAPRDGLSPDSELARARSTFGTKVSDDGATLFFWPLRRERSAPPLALMRAPLDASAPPVATLTVPDADTLAMDVVDQQGGVFLVRVSGRVGANQELLRLDAATGATLETMPWSSSDRGVALSGDGSTIYASNACQVGAASGTSVVRVSRGVGHELIPCQLSAPGSFLAVPHSTNVLHVPAARDSFQLLTPAVH